MHQSALVIRDFEKQTAIKPAEVAELVRKLPKDHYRGLKTILFKPITEMARLNLLTDHGCKGAYFPEHRAIIIHDLVDSETAPHIIYHEIGHYVFHQFIDSQTRKHWTTKLFPGAPAVTPYAKTNPAEDFAETYALFAQDQDHVRKKTPQKFLFMQKLFKCFRHP